MRRARWKRKNVRRVGLRRRRPPAAGGGRLALPCRSQGRKRPALGESSIPGKFGIHPAPIFAAAGSSARERERQRKEKQRQYDNHPDEVGTIRHGSAATGIAEENSVPEGQAQIGAGTDTPTPVARRATAPERANAFLFGPCTARFSFGAAKEKWGVHPAGQAPLREQESPVAAVRRPLPLGGVANATQPRWSLRPSR